MKTKTEKSGNADTKTAQQPTGCPSQVLLVYHRPIDYPRPPKAHDNRVASALRIIGGLIVAASFICWLGTIGRSDTDPAFALRELMLSMLLWTCVGIFGAILLRISTLLNS